MYVVIVLGILAAGLTAMRWMDAQEKAARRAYEFDGK